MQKRRSHDSARPLSSTDVKIDILRERLGAHEPDQADLPSESHAAVAVVFREGTHSVEVLLIERAEREGDPWSGHMAFPGGRMEPEDDSTRGAAQRETYEEVGVDLANAEYLGQLDDIIGNPSSRPTLVVAAHAFYIARDQSFTIDREEVQMAFWFPLADMLEESRSVDYTIVERPDMRFPGILVGIPDRHVVWGMTYRFLENLLRVLGHSIPKS
jgi:8-oxo-dGTP pyrophosphatase MutT (NUDIX family)